MSEYLFKEKYRIASNRIQGHDYSANGSYFITICTNNRECYFGDVSNGQMELNQSGRIATEYLCNIDSQSPFIILDEFVVMPNHVHIIIIIKNRSSHDDGVRENSFNNHFIHDGVRENSGIFSTATTMGNRRKMIIPMIIGKFKMITSKKINILRGTIGNKLWQPNYYEHIIRNEDELYKIRQYIKNNPIKWESDRNKK